MVLRGGLVVMLRRQFRQVRASVLGLATQQAVLRQPRSSDARAWVKVVGALQCASTEVHFYKRISSRDIVTACWAQLTTTCKFHLCGSCDVDRSPSIAFRAIAMLALLFR